MASALPEGDYDGELVVKHTFIHVSNKAPNLRRVDSDSAIRYSDYGSSIMTKITKAHGHKHVNSDNASSLADAETSSDVTESSSDDDPLEWMSPLMTSSTDSEQDDFDDVLSIIGLPASFSSASGVDIPDLPFQAPQARITTEVAQCAVRATQLEAQAQEAEERAQLVRQEALQLARQVAASKAQDAEAVARLAQCKSQLRAIPPPQPSHEISQAMYHTNCGQEPLQPMLSDSAHQVVWMPVFPTSTCHSPVMSPYRSPAMSAYLPRAMTLAMLETQKNGSPRLSHRIDVASARDSTAPQHQQKTPNPVVTPTQAFTTLMLRNLPNSYTRDMLIELLDKAGLSGNYDLVYVPVDFIKLAGLGYAFVNFTSDEAAEKARQAFQGFTGWSNTSQKVCEVSWSKPLQGLSAHIEHYRNSPVMHNSVPECYKPVLFQGGIRRPFPRPTQEIQTPRMKRRGFHSK